MPWRAQTCQQHIRGSMVQPGMPCKLRSCEQLLWPACYACQSKRGRGGEAATPLWLCRLTQRVSRKELESVMHSKAGLNRLLLRVSKVKLVRVPAALVFWWLAGGCMDSFNSLHQQCSRLGSASQHACSHGKKRCFNCHEFSPDVPLSGQVAAAWQM